MKLLAIISLIILGTIFSDPIIGGGDHDKTAYQIDQLITKLNTKSLEELKSNALSIENYTKTKIPILLNEESPLIGGLHDFIFKQDRETLIRWAFTAKAHNRNSTQINLIGGLHYTIQGLTNLQISNYILGIANKFPSLNNSAELERLSQLYGVSENNFGKVGGIHDYLFRQNRETLIRWALTAEKHERTLRNVRIYGGIHDRLKVISDIELAEFIFEKSKEYPELDSGIKLDEYSSVYKIKNSALINQIGGIHDYILRQSRDTLIKWALTCQFHDRKEKNTTYLLGGLDDYIEKLDDKEIGQYIVNMVKTYPSLNNYQKLEILAEEYKIKNEKKKNLTFLAAEDDEEELVDYILRQSRDVIIQLALACESYDREMKGIHVIGGLDDIVDTLSNRDIIDYILEKAGEYKELNSNEFLESLVLKYQKN